MRVFPTPEEAARGDIPARFVRTVGVVVRGDIAVVAQLTNDGPVHEIETASCHREGDGWVEGSSGNGNGAYLPTSHDSGTFVVWEEAPTWAVAARYERDDDRRVFPVDNGFVIAAYDDAPLAAYFTHFQGWPGLVSWIDADGAEHPPAAPWPPSSA